MSPRATVCGGVDCAHLQRHGPAAGLEGVLIGRGNAAGLVRDVEPRHLGGVPGQLVVIWRDYGGHVRLHAVPFAKLLLLHDLVLDVDDGGLRREVRVGVVPSNAPTHTSSSSAQDGLDSKGECMIKKRLCDPVTRGDSSKQSADGVYAWACQHGHMAQIC